MQENSEREENRSLILILQVSKGIAPWKNRGAILILRCPSL
jgi:hypothetical protein